jgi:hypothetical protein
MPYRQDWSLEVSFELYPLLQPLLDYEVKTLLDDPNILRDSVLMQLECLYFEAYVHVGAIMWRVIFRESRALTNSKGLELNPLALNRYTLIHTPQKCSSTPLNTTILFCFLV